MKYSSRTPVVIRSVGSWVLDISLSDDLRRLSQSQHQVRYEDALRERTQVWLVTQRPRWQVSPGWTPSSVVIIRHDAG